MFHRVKMRLAAFALSLLPFMAHAQITVTSADVLSLLGKTQVTRDDTTGSVTVNVGAAGANQTWDFRALVLRAENFTTQYVPPQTTPFAAQFPQSNFVQKVELTGANPGTAYVYSNVAASAWTQIGLALTSQDTTFFDTTEEQVAPLPLQMNRTWTVTTSDTIGDLATFAFINKNVSVNTVDAWGTIRLQLGDLACLSVRSNESNYSQTYFGGMLVSNDSSKSIGYLWVTKGHGMAASISSQDGVTNPNFTDAASVTLLQSTNTAVDEPEASEALPHAFALAQNYPNPFSMTSASSTAMRLELTRATYTELAIFTLQGERVRVLAAQMLAPGAHTYRWDGRDDAGRALASGTYIYRLKAGNVQRSRTLLLVK